MNLGIDGYSTQVYAFDCAARLTLLEFLLHAEYKRRQKRH